MPHKLQEGIYIRGKDYETRGRKPSSVRNKTFAIAFLRVRDPFEAKHVKASLMKLWNTYRLLKSGKVVDTVTYPIPHGNLTVLIGYGLRTFGLSGVTKEIPRALRIGQFLPSKKDRAILRGSGIKYSCSDSKNLGLSEHLVIQFISDSQTATYRAIEQTWRVLSQREYGSPVYMTNFFTGFQRDDCRSWLGFHDEISNIKDMKERKSAIVIDDLNNLLEPDDLWTVGGTYLCFLRIIIDLSVWKNFGRKKEELIIGRDKLTGDPVIGVDKRGNPLVNRGSNHKSGNILSKRDFRDHPDYFAISATRRGDIDLQRSIKILNQSHIGRTRHFEGIATRYSSSRRIYRQGFEFIENTSYGNGNPMRTGLNFVSFQNEPSRLLFILTDPHWMGNANFGGRLSDPSASRLLSVHAAGFFFVPKYEKPFPGAGLFG